MPSTLYIVGTLYGSVVECLLYVKAKKRAHLILVNRLRKVIKKIVDSDIGLNIS